MAAAKTQQPRPFMTILRSAAPAQVGRWEKISYVTPLPGRPAEMATPFAVQALTGLAEGTAKVAYADGATPAFMAEPTPSYRMVYRAINHEIAHNQLIFQPPYAATVMAAVLLANGENAALTDAYVGLLEGMAANLPQSELDDIAMLAGDVLCHALEESFDLESLTWNSEAQSDESLLTEWSDPTKLPLDGLFSDPAVFAAYRRGEPTDYSLLSARAAAGATAGGASPVNVGPTDFVGPQLSATLFYMKEEGKNVLFHGPTGCGKSFVWDLAMKELYGPDYDPATYPYFVHGSEGLEDIDLIGQIVPQADGSKQWVNGPLVNAMLDGKRLKVEEINRMPARHAAVLLGAMDFGRIALTRHMGEVVNAAPGFAIDAMANIGAEYTGTEDIDPALLRRFTRKVEFRFLEPDQEAVLLRSRHATLDATDATVLVRIANAVRDAYAEAETDGGRVFDVDLYVSQAALLETADLVCKGMKIPEAIEATWMAEVAKTHARREGVRAMIDQHLREKKRGLAGKGRKK